MVDRVPTSSAAQRPPSFHVKKLWTKAFVECMIQQVFFWAVFSPFFFFSSADQSRGFFFPYFSLAGSNERF